MPDKKIPILVKTFEEFALFVKSKWRASLLAIVFIALLGGIFLSLYYGYRRIELLGTELDRGLVLLEDSHTTSEELQTDFESSVEQNIAVEKEMTRCLFKHGAEAMIVFKFHNSRTDLQGKHDFFYSGTNEVSLSGAKGYMPEAQFVPVVRLGQYITPMLNGKCQVVHIDTMPDNLWLKGKLQLQGIQTIISCPIFSNGNLIGFTELIYTADNPAPVEDEDFPETLKCFKETTDRIGLIIQK